MHTSGKASQLFITLYICFVAPVILLRSNNFSSASAWSCIVELTVFSAVLLLFFLPSYFLLRNRDQDIFMIAHNKTPVGALVLSEFYAGFFVYASVKFLKNYTDMMTRAINPQANSYVIAFLIIAVCVYAAVKGVGAVTRSSIIIFAIVVISFVVIFTGNISKIELKNFSFNYNGVFSKDNIFLDFAPSLISAPIFAVLCGNTKGSKCKAFSAFLVLTAVTSALVFFFTSGVLGNFGSERDFSFFTLSKISGAAGFSGFDSFYLICSAAATIILISIMFVCINKTVATNGSAKNTIMFAILTFVLFICAENFYSVSEILYNDFIFLSVCFIFSVAIPTGYLAKFGRKRL